MPEQLLPSDSDSAERGSAQVEVGPNNADRGADVGDLALKNSGVELAEHASEQAASALDLASDLEARLDYDKLVGALMGREQKLGTGSRSPVNLMYDTMRLHSIRQMLEGGIVGIPAEELEGAKAGLRQFEDDWRGHGLLRSDKDAEHDQNVPQLSANQSRQLVSDLEKAEMLNSRYKFSRTNLLNSEIYFDITNIARILSSPEVPPKDLNDAFISVSLALNDGLRGALSKQLLAGIRRLPPHDFDVNIDTDRYAAFIERARAIDVDEALGQMEVAGDFAELPFDYSEKRLKEFLGKSIPPVALAGVKRVEFRPMTKEEDGEDGASGYHLYQKEIDGSVVVIATTRLRDIYQSAMHDDETESAAESAKWAELSARAAMENTLVHEFGHELHEQLPTAALKRWDDASSSDPVHITRYVKRQFEADNMHAYCEDFADSNELFVMLPEALHSMSSVRYDQMSQLYHELMPTYGEVLEPIQSGRMLSAKLLRQSAGISETEAREGYLRYETEQ